MTAVALMHLNFSAATSLAEQADMRAVGLKAQSWQVCGQAGEHAGGAGEEERLTRVIRQVGPWWEVSC